MALTSKVLEDLVLATIVDLGGGATEEIEYQLGRLGHHDSIDEALAYLERDEKIERVGAFGSWQATEKGSKVDVKLPPVTEPKRRKASNRRRNYAERECERCGATFKPNSGAQKKCNRCRGVAEPTQAEAMEIMDEIEETRLEKEATMAANGGGERTPIPGEVPAREVGIPIPGEWSSLRATFIPGYLDRYLDTLLRALNQRLEHIAETGELPTELMDRIEKMLELKGREPLPAPIAETDPTEP
jgi:hypothetical protein